MRDFVSEALGAAALHHAWAPALACVAGAASSAGPCAAPRFLAIAALTADRSRLQVIAGAAAFAAGLAAAFALYGAAASLLAQIARSSAYVYVALAAVLAGSGLVSLLREPRECAQHRHTKHSGTGGAFLLGAGSALVPSPCCTPLAGGIAAYASASGDALYAGLLLACFAVGHALPAVAVAAGTHGLADVLRRLEAGGAARTVSSALTIGLAGYYAVLA